MKKKLIIISLLIIMIVSIISCSSISNISLSGVTMSYNLSWETPASWWYLEKLTSNLKDMYSIKINDQWRIIFDWIDGDAYNVKITDYHN